MGSDSDMPAMEACMKQLDEFHVPYEVKVASAYRKRLEDMDGRNPPKSAASA